MKVWLLAFDGLQRPKREKIIDRATRQELQ